MMTHYSHDSSVDTCANAAPTTQTERIHVLDILRGVAVLGILIMNIWSFAWPKEVNDYPVMLNAFEGNTVATWAVVHILFEGSPRAIFSVLFGAGALLIIQRLKGKYTTISAAKLYYKRTILLICLGLVNAYTFLWPADILFVYGLCGLVLYPLSNFKSKTLLSLALIALAILGAIRWEKVATLEDLQQNYEAAHQPTASLGSIDWTKIKAWEIELKNARPSLDAKSIQTSIL